MEVAIALVGFGAVIGAVVGIMFGAPVIGTIIGAVVGVFLPALAPNRDSDQPSTDWGDPANRAGKGE